MTVMPVSVTLLLVRIFIFFKKFPCLCRRMSSSISFIVLFSHFSLSSLTALLTLLQQLMYSLRLSTSVHSSCHFSKARCFSISFNVSSVIYFLLYCLFLCRCCVADLINAFFISFHLSSIFPRPLLFSSCFLMVLWYSTLLCACFRSSTSRHFPSPQSAFLQFQPQGNHYQAMVTVHLRSSVHSGIQHR